MSQVCWSSYKSSVVLWCMATGITANLNSILSSAYVILSYRTQSHPILMWSSNLNPMNNTYLVFKHYMVTNIHSICLKKWCGSLLILLANDGGFKSMNSNSLKDILIVSTVGVWLLVSVGWTWIARGATNIGCIVTIDTVFEVAQLLVLVPLRAQVSEVLDTDH